MSESVVATGATEIIEAMIVDTSQLAITGLTDIKIDIRRKSDGKLLDFNDMTFKAAGWTTRQLALTETDATNEAGWYRYSFVMSNIVSPVADDVYTVTVRQTSLTTAANVPQFGVIRTGAFVDTIATILTDTNDLQTRVPAALVAGRIDASVGAMAAGVVTAAAVATDAIDADALAASAVAEIQSGLAVAADLAPLQADLDDIQTRLPAALVAGRMDSSVGAVAANAITATAIAAGAIGASEAPLLANLDVASSTLATAAALALVQADTDDLQARVPAALVGGRMDASVGAMAAGVVTAAAVATDAIDSDAIAASAVTEIQAGLATAAALTTAQGNITTILGYGAPPTAVAIGGAVWDIPSASHIAAGSVGELLASIAVDTTNLDVAVSTRASAAALTTMQGNVTSILAFGAPPSAAANAAAVWATADGAGTMGASLALLRRRQTNKRVLSAGGVLSFYADDGVTVEKTATVTDVTGAAVTIVAGDPARSTAEA